MAGARVLVLGITFKENCPDVRNTRVVDIIHAFKEYGTEVDVYDPWADQYEVAREYGIVPFTDLGSLSSEGYDAVVLAVAHDEFRKMDETKLKELCSDKSVVFDIKNVLSRTVVDARL